MKNDFLKFAPIGGIKRGKLPARTNRWNNRRGTCYETDAPETPDPEAAALLTEIDDRIKTEITSKGFKNGDEIRSLIGTALTGLSLEALRNYTKDKTALELSIRNLDANFKKVEQRTKEIVKEARTKPLQDLLEKNWKEIELAMRSKGTGKVVTLTTRAATIMTMGDAVEEPSVDDMPNAVIESFSVDAFVKKRRPNEWIFEIANRTTVPEITEYKTWLEEGGEEGTFAIVEEGAVKPLMSKSLQRNVVHYKKIAGKRVYTEEFAKFRKEAFRIIEELFNDKILRDYAALLVTELMTKAAAYVGTTLDGQFENPTDYHAIGAVASQIEAIDFFPDLLIMNPQDKWRIGLSQNTQGTFYMNVPVYNPSGEVSMLGFRLVTSNRVPVGTAILGESKLYKIEDEPVQVRMGFGIDVTKDEDGFVTDVSSDVDNNRFRIIAETFFRSWIATNHIGSFVSFNFADVKEALLKPLAAI